MRLRRAAYALVAAVLTAGLVVGVVSGVFGTLARGTLYATGLWSRNGPSTLTPGALDPPAGPAPSGPAATATPDQPLPAPVLAPAEPAPAQAPAKVRAKVGGVTVSGAPGAYSGAVVDLGTDDVLFRARARDTRIPASTMKLLTAGAALSRLGPDHRFETTVVAGPGRGRQVVLVGGGDPYLEEKPRAGAPGRATVATLARRTAAQLKAAGLRQVSLGYDAALFRGTAWNPTWPDGYSDVVTRTSALWVGEGRLSGSVGPRERDPARAAADAFAAALRAQGVKVSAVAAARAPAGAEELASVESLPLEQIVRQLLMVSDNDAAEVVFRHVALAGGRPGSAAEAATAVRAELTELGVWAGGRVRDGSGLSRDNRVPAETLVRLLRLAADDEHPELRPLFAGLPVAGVEGSLQRRFGDDASLAGRGLVRGKTGTLRKVQTLAGVVRTRDGALLAYAFLVNDPENEYNALVWLDRVTAALAGCGCRR